MVIYSHSRLGCFEQCPHKFKLQYIDKVETELEESIEAFLGSRTHETLEKLYRDQQYQKESIDVVFGSNNKIRIKISQRYSCPSKHSREREQLEQLLRKHGKWDDVAQLDTSAINKIIQEKKWDMELLDALEEYVKLEESKRLYLSKLKDR